MRAHTRLWRRAEVRETRPAYRVALLEQLEETAMALGRLDRGVGRALRLLLQVDGRCLAALHGGHSRSWPLILDSRLLSRKHG